MNTFCVAFSASLVLLLSLLISLYIHNFHDESSWFSSTTSPFSSETAADLLVTNGTIYTSDSSLLFADSMAIRDGRILRIGNHSFVQEVSGHGTKELNLEGKIVVPGFIDSHVHLLFGGLQMARVEVRGVNTKDGFIGKVKEAVKDMKEGTWLLGGGWNNDLWGGELPSASWIDDVTPHHPRPLQPTHLPFLSLFFKPLCLVLKPHRSSESSWQAIRSVVSKRSGSEALGGADRGSSLSFRDFSLVRQIGSGDIGKVYLCRLRNEDVEEKLENRCYYAMKVVDREVLALKKKIERAATEKKILNMLDHPFLPTLYAQFDASHFSCVVMEYCSGGDLHSLRHQQPQKRFSLSAARFYAAEVLVALEYLHMLGIIYRDLKPENVLVRSDGHIMLTDFDLSLCSDAIPAVQSQSLSSSPDLPASSPAVPRPPSGGHFSCLPSQLFRSKKIQSFSAAKRLFVAEPVTARSCSFVGTHEYVTPEVASGQSHGNAVDWWALGIFIYEMVYGCTPFVGVSNEATLRNIVKKPLKFPTVSTIISSRETQARDLISRLLDKDPERRFGSKRGAADIKTHPFFNGLNFALIRSATPPVIPRQKTMATTTSSRHFGGPTLSFDFF